MKKKILFLHDTFPAGGAERITIDIANYITTFGYEVYVSARTLNVCENKSIQVIELPDKKTIDSHINIDFLTRTVKELHIDIFVLVVLQLVELFEEIHTKTGCKLVFSLHSIPLWEITHHLYEKKNKSRGSIGKMLEWHLLTYPKTMWLRKYDKPMINTYDRIYQLADAYTVLCDEYKREYLRKWAPSQDKIDVIYNTERVVETVNLDKKKQVMFAGRLTYADKRIDKLLKIWKRVYKKAEEWELIIVGDGPEREHLERYVNRKRIERIKFAGYTNDVQSYYNDASILCLTSVYEGWPLCLSEAQANGVIPVAFDCTAGVREMLSPSEVNGFLIPPFKLGRYAKTLLALIKDTEKQNAMRPGLIAKAAQYSPDIVGENWLNLFDSLLKDEK
ncbi:glycosyltransferase [Proteiniphilum sp. UBA5384]|uniref:glycosyltransferase n=1 Tax=Proteiniphilum sp. UBA5384 TaxID=1947279 RepID=UPI0025F4F5B0|nr:glycosyltransferase [Proteiniphilum sp. UBA5384]